MDAALLFFAYAQLAAWEGARRGHVLEIGVAQGLSLIAVGALRGPQGRVVAVDTFGRDERDVARSGGMWGEEKQLRANLTRHLGDGFDLEVIASDSQGLRAADLGEGFSFCHIDGGHSAEETHHDVALAAEISLPGGLVAVDDHFNPSFPGVSEGSIRFLTERPGTLVPLAIGANKVLYQRAPATEGLNARFAERHPEVPTTRAVLAGREVLLFGSGIEPYIDLEASTVERLVARETVLRVGLEPKSRDLEIKAGEAASLDVLVRNEGNVPLAWSDSPFGLSYHVLHPDGSNERYDNTRVWFTPALAEGQERVMSLSVVAPEKQGDYLVEIDVVWEGHCWLRERGSKPARIDLRVR